MEIKVLKSVMAKNDAKGKDNRDLFEKNKVYTINITSSPGAGKTTLLENSLQEIISRFNTAIIEGDLYTSRDAERLQNFDIPLVQINTEGGCHLDAQMIHESIRDLSLEKLDLLLIENVGNLVCPSSFDLGENLRVLLYSITEGVDKPTKYATMFKNSQVIIINKIDLAGPCEIDLDDVEKEVREVNPVAKVFMINSKNPESVRPWVEWLGSKIESANKTT